MYCMALLRVLTRSTSSAAAGFAGSSGPEARGCSSSSLFRRPDMSSTRWRRLSTTRCCFFALNGAFCGWPGRGERLLRAKLFWGGAGARNQVQSRAEYRCTLLSSSASSQRDLAAPL